MNLEPPSEHQLLVFWVAIVVLVVTARLLGAAMRRLGQPAVVGELGAGLVLGPSLLGRLLPDVGDWLFPDDAVQSGMLFTVGWIGVVLLLVATGYETDLALIRRLGSAAAFVSTGSLVIPLAAGFGVGAALPALYVGDDTDRLVFSLFIAAALAISSLPVIAKILVEMGVMRRNFGQLTLAAGMANDVVGWILLGLIAGLAQSDTVRLGDLGITLVGVALVIALAMTLGQRLVDVAFRRTRTHDPSGLGGVSVVLIAALATGAVTQWLGVEAVLGAFIAGIVLGRSRFRDSAAMHHVEKVTNAFFAPVFFATAGLQVDLGLLSSGTTLLWTAVVILAASAAKFGGAFVGASLAGLDRREGAALGVGLNARGALEIVIATVGLSLGVLNQTSYTIIVVMAMATSMAAPPLLRAVLSGWEGSDGEQRRIERERTLRAGVLVRPEPLLIASQGGHDSVMAAGLVGLVWPPEVAATVVTVSDNGHRPDFSPLDNALGDREVDHRVLRGEDVTSALEREARLGYGVLVVGASETNGQLPPLIARLVAESPIPVLVVRRGRSVASRLPWAFSRAVVPISTGPTSKPAVEIAFNLSASLGTEVNLVHVVTDATSENAPLLRRIVTDTTGISILDRSRPHQVGRKLLHEAAAAAGTAGARITTHLVESQQPGEAITEYADSLDADLVIVSAHRRRVHDEKFLGATVESILATCDATVVVVVNPDEVAASSYRHSGA